jgi:GLPGLI family protein
MFQKIKKIAHIIFLFGLLGNAQIKNGTVTYGVKSMFGDGPELLPIKSELDKAKAAENVFAFTLNFNETESYFFANPSLDLYYQSKDDFCSMLMINNGIYAAPFKNEFRRNYDFEKTKYIEKYEQKAYWELTNQTKIISGYTCFKATTIQFNGHWNDDPKFLTTAWYCPAITVQYGPNGYYGLPGLILEVETYTTTLYAKKITLDNSKKYEINKLDKGIFITMEEVEKRLNESGPKEFNEMVAKDIKESEERSQRIEKEQKAKKEAKQKAGQ